MTRGSPAFRPGFLGRLHHLTRIRRQDGKGTTIMLKTLQISTAATFVAVNEALAQTTPAPATPAATDGGASWLWLIVVLAIVAAVAWYFLRGRSRTTTTGTTGTSATSGTAGDRPNVYDKDRRT